jgi:hypothetical protein
MSAAGLREDDDGWLYVAPVEGVHTVILGESLMLGFCYTVANLNG